MKERATNSREKTSTILSQMLLTASDDIRAQLPPTESMRRHIRKLKRGALPKEPSTAAEIDLPEEYTKTGPNDGTPFLVYDNKDTPNRRMLVFATDQGLRHLCRARQWFMDGTFKTCPRVFHQLYIIRVPLDQGAITVVYAFLPGKTTAIYEEYLRALVEVRTDRGYDLDPQTVLVDFEVAISNAIQDVFGAQVVIRRCFYHLKQAIWRKIQELGLSVPYTTDAAFQKWARMMGAVAFLPLTDVPDAIDFLRNECPQEAEELLEYFDATYATGTYRQIRQPAADPDAAPPPMRIRHVAPRYPPDVWNQCEATIQQQARTNNWCEGWNNSFRMMVGHDHPSIWFAIQCLQQDAAIVGTTIAKSATGQPATKRRRLVDMQQRLRTMCEARATGARPLDETLRGLAHNIRLQ